MFRRWFPSIPLTLSVVAFWLVMNDAFNPAHIAFGLLLGLVIPLFAARLDREFARIGSLRGVPRLLMHLLWDILVSNITVARQVLGRETRIHPGFVWYPLDIDNIHGIAALASMITLTPGTVTTTLSGDRKYLLIHVFNLDDADAMIAGIKDRYERPLMEIFP
ncbi:Na+/H+ antiporter subunit E [Arenimonas caeni]|jgi:multicomponent K+:H+ antiporter subunit E|uniref:Na+/H+ antiporter subunit E n=1 Tax=Arenimonas caeni TaxID=2058085 RepID=UPI002A36E414|nr:Na+/H+ antiporter subunit E [Arenimonas caeni]MDY0022401.1 Na+/H+ antiporter subunit E [Arenimonas caeni]